MSGALPFSRKATLRAERPAESFVLSPSAAEMAALAAALDLVAVRALTLEGSLERVSGGFAWQGRLEALVVQRCVVTHAPVTQRIAVPVGRRFVVAAAPATADVEVDPDADEIDYVPTGEVDLGAVAVEELSLALDPYPRTPDADAVVARYAPEDTAAGSERANPFAALAQRRFDA